MSPMVIYFAPSGSKSTQVLTLENPDSEKIPVQIEVFTRGVDAKGEEVRVKSSDFNVYPEQVVLLPNEKRNVRVTWAGEFKGDDEKSYRIVVSQIPVEFKEQNAKSKKPGVSLNFLLQYVASAYVTPGNAAAKVRVKETKVLGPKKVLVTLVNEGTAHKVIHTKKLKLVSGNKIVMEIADPKEFEGLNLLAKTEKTVTLTLSKEIPQGVKAELEFAELGD
ncbi:fimbria/pilus periplasmic chaperone [Bdellovibrio sp. PAP01]|uniref:Fimbria/pilus periplasmic chaperone n=2 Tax=Bdellovibrio svalbardensis TaxID=2972972 RepID=A0ABT6DD23_9BACT|nr:fimbria/pilus periplasmic chaperone [Bdellovibrio svalbardensis]